MDYLKISRTYGEIEIKTTPARMRIHSRMPHFRMKQRPPEMVVKRQQARIVIDKRLAFADRGNKTIFTLMDEFAKWATDVCAEAIARISAEGTEISRAGKNRGDIIRQIILNRMNDKNLSINVDFAQSPDVKWEEGYLEVNWIIHEPEIEWEVSAKAEIEVDPSSIEIRLRKRPTLKTEVVRKNDTSNYILNREI